MATFTAQFTESPDLQAVFIDASSLAAEFGDVIEVDKHINQYEGPYEVTPTQDTQILSTAMKMAVEDIVINPIPSNYGLITWDGSVLTVS